MSEELSRRSTSSNKIPEIDSLYVYKTRHNIKFSHRNQPGTGYRYMNKKAVMKAGEDEIHIYHRTAKINGISMGITMVTKDGRVRTVQKWLKEQIKEIETSEALFERFKQGTHSPVELGLYYTY